MLVANPSETFGQLLLAHVALCYSVSLALTRDQETAQKLTLDVMRWAWHAHDDADDTAGIKTKLLSALRAKYLSDYRVVEQYAL